MSESAIPGDRSNEIKDKTGSGIKAPLIAMGGEVSSME